MTKCARVGGWEGTCKNEALPEKRFCQKDSFFENKKCSYAGCPNPVVCYCISAGSLVCGKPLCGEHKEHCKIHAY